ncbi:uncharacterized protein O3C94_004652 [Discoglossus pictus]
MGNDLGTFRKPEQVSGISWDDSRLQWICCKKVMSNEDVSNKSCGISKASPTESNYSWNCTAEQCTAKRNQQNDCGPYIPLEYNPIKERPSTVPIYRESQLINIESKQCLDDKSQYNIAKDELDSSSLSSIPSCILQCPGLFSLANTLGNTDMDQAERQAEGCDRHCVDPEDHLSNGIEWEEIDLGDGMSKAGYDDVTDKMDAEEEAIKLETIVVIIMEDNNDKKKKCKGKKSR